MTRFVPAPIRWAAERLSRKAVFRSRLPARFGRRSIYLSPGNQLAVLKPGENKFEGYLLGFVERFVEPGSVVWDIGANMGVFAFPAAHKVGSTGFVLAFEPDPFNQLILQRTRIHPDNLDLNITVLPAAVSREVGTAELEIANRGRAANSLSGAAHGSQTGGIRERLTVMTVTLDWVAERYRTPQFVKCDAEGAEAWILEGATKLLATVRPVINMEMPKDNAETCKAIFLRNDYATFDAYEPITPGKELAAIDAVWEVLAVPRERIKELATR